LVCLSDSFSGIFWLCSWINRSLFYSCHICIKLCFYIKQVDYCLEMANKGYAENTKLHPVTIYQLLGRMITPLLFQEPYRLVNQLLTKLLKGYCWGRVICRSQRAWFDLVNPRKCLKPLCLYEWFHSDEQVRGRDTFDKTILELDHLAKIQNCLAPEPIPSFTCVKNTSFPNHLFQHSPLQYTTYLI